MIQKLILLGNLGSAFELKTTKDGKAWATASLAVNTKQRAEKSTTWYKLLAFGKAAEILSGYAQKGQTLYVEGAPQVETWLPKNSVEPRAQISVLIDQFQLLGGKAQDTTPKDEAAIAANATQGNDDLEWL